MRVLCGMQHENLTTTLVLSPADGMAIENVPASDAFYLPGTTGPVVSMHAHSAVLAEQMFETAAARDSAYDQWLTKLGKCAASSAIAFGMGEYLGTEEEAQRKRQWEQQQETAKRARLEAELQEAMALAGCPVQ